MIDIREILKQEADAIMNIPVSDVYEKVTDLIYKHVHLSDGKVITSGMGKAGQIAMNIATTLSSTGTPAVFLHPSEAQHGDLGILQRNDILITISNSGRTREVIELVTLARNLVPDIPFIVITGNPECELAAGASFVIPTGNPPEVCLLGLTPTTSTTVMTVIGDTLVILLQEKTGFSNSDYASRHHGGYLGTRSRDAIKNGNK